MLKAAIRKLLVAGLMLLSSATGRLRADEQPAAPAARVAKPESTEPRDENVLAEFEVAKNGDYLLLPVTIQGKTYSFLVDTGATHHVFDVTLRPLLGKAGKNVSLGTTGKTTTVETYDSPEAYVSRFPVRTSEPVICMDLQSMREAIGHPAFGILGMPFFRSHIVQIDCDNGKLRFLQSVTENAGTRTSLLHRNITHPFVVAQIDGVGPVTMVVDTGFNGTIMCELSLFEKCSRRNVLIPCRTGISEALTDVVRYPMGKLKTFRLQGFVHNDLYIAGREQSRIGMRYLSRYQSILDFPGQALWLKPGRIFNAPDQMDHSGLCLHRKNGQTIVWKVYDQSPGSDVDIRVGDQLKEVNGTSAAHLSLFEIGKILSAATGTATLLVSRSERDSTVRITLRDYRNEATRE